jgi:uncharacterized membrane protein YeaQ/YmgE (transglycosylase-associated protein family)
MMHWVWTIIIGFVAGLIAKTITPGGGPSGFLITAVLGIAGSLAATFLGQVLVLSPPCLARLCFCLFIILQQKNNLH